MTGLSGIELVRSVHCPTSAVCGLEGGSTCSGSGALGGYSIQSNGAKYRQRSGVPPGDTIGGVLPPGVGGADGGNCCHITSSDYTGRQDRSSYNILDPPDQLYQYIRNKNSINSSSWLSPSEQETPASFLSSPTGYFIQQPFPSTNGFSSPSSFLQLPRASGASFAPVIAAPVNSNCYPMSSNNNYSNKYSPNSRSNINTMMKQKSSLADRLQIGEEVRELKLGCTFNPKNTTNAFHTIKCK